jgi:hypothetical protein
MYINYQLALALNEEARQKAALYRLANSQRTQSGFAKRLQNLFAKQPAAKKGEYGLQ